VNSRTTERFRRAFARLPQQVQRQARDAHRLFQNNPHHPSLWFKLVNPLRSIYSVRISRDYRALGVREANTIIWFWIGSHAEYDQLISRL
jgi:hypothetical protein